LGFGAMRLPTTDPQDRTTIDEDLATRMVRYAIDHGVNYIDTAYPYHSGESERFVGRVLQDGYREKVNLATKLPMWAIEAREDAERILNEQLEKLQTDHIDFYLFHGLRKPRWETVQSSPCWTGPRRRWRTVASAIWASPSTTTSTSSRQIIDAYDGWDVLPDPAQLYGHQHPGRDQGAALRRRQRDWAW
jgi:uncharacterized protein